MTRRELPFLTPRLITVLAGSAAVLAGLLMTVAPAAGIGFTFALGFTVAAVLNLRLALVVWTLILFFQIVPFGPTLVSLLVLFAWLGTTRQRRMRGRWEGIGRSMKVAVTLLLLWLTLGLAWTDRIDEGAPLLIPWFLAAAILVIVTTTIRTASEVMLIIGAIVVGATISVVFGLLLSGLGPAGGAIETAGAPDGRLTGGAFDPNNFAAALVPAIVLAGGLAAAARPGLLRSTLLPAVVVIAVGLGATQSRGGFVAALVAAVTAVAVVRHHRVRVLLCVAVLAVAAGVQFINAPGAWERVVEDSGGSGRTELWTVGLRVAESHPFVGAGLGDFVNEAPLHVREPGSLESVMLIAERPHIVHNSYLQIYAEQGAVGLALYIVVILAGLAATFGAGARFEKVAQRPLATLARAVLVAQISVLTALFFVSKGWDPLMWLLLALGVALRRVAQPRETSVTAPGT